MTRDQIMNLKEGDLVTETIDTRHGQALPGARWTKPSRIVRIHARGISVKGKAYVCYYRDFGPNSTISGSVSEGEDRVRCVNPESTD